MQTLTYRQAYDKIIEAYFKDEIKPFNNKFCICGTLSPNQYWDQQHGRDLTYPYSANEYGRMEYALIKMFDGVEYTGIRGCQAKEYRYIHEYVESLGSEYEEVIFKGMSAALDVLKEIHRSRGENVDEEIPVFTQRKINALVS